MSDQLEAMALAAESIDAEISAADPGVMMAAQEHAQAAEQGAENVGQIRMILDMAMPLLGALYPSLPEIYTEPTRAAVAASLGPVLQKYGINMNDWGSAYKEEIRALMVCGPIAWATVQGIKADIQAREKAVPKAVILDAPPSARETEENATLG